jgi:hypothetical protein
LFSSSAKSFLDVAKMFSVAITNIYFISGHKKTQQTDFKILFAGDIVKNNY